MPAKRFERLFKRSEGHNVFGCLSCRQNDTKPAVAGGLLRSCG